MTLHSEDTLTLSEFLATRIAEDEAIARAAQAGLARWQTDDDECCVLIDDGYKDATETHFNGTAVHIARWDPARVLAECEAKRRIAAMHAETMTVYREAGEFCSYDSEWSREGLDDIYVPAPCPTLKLLALPYASHPDYRDEWRA